MEFAGRITSLGSENLTKEQELERLRTEQNIANINMKTAMSAQEQKVADLMKRLNDSTSHSR
jgi:multidrug resistance efflux pump